MKFFCAGSDNHEEHIYLIQFTDTVQVVSEFVPR